jgi:hypothetical protein
VGIVALSKGKEDVGPWANPRLAWLLSAENYFLGLKGKTRIENRLSLSIL